MDVGREMLNTEQQSSTAQCHVAQQRSESSPPPSKKRTVQKSTVDRWIAESDKTLSTATWLVYEIDRTNRSRVVSLKCSVCTRYSQKLVGMRNYNSAFVEGTSNLRTSSFKDHASSEMHARAMQLHKKQVKRPFNSVYRSNECFSYTGIN